VREGQAGTVCSVEGAGPGSTVPSGDTRHGSGGEATTSTDHQGTTREDVVGRSQETGDGGRYSGTNTDTGTDTHVTGRGGAADGPCQAGRRAVTYAQVLSASMYGPQFLLSHCPGSTTADRERRGRLTGGPAGAPLPGVAPGLPGPAHSGILRCALASLRARPRCVLRPEHTPCVIVADCCCLCLKCLESSAASDFAAGFFHTHWRSSRPPILQSVVYCFCRGLACRGGHWGAGTCEHHLQLADGGSHGCTGAQAVAL